MMQKPYRITCDIGGTFTDIVGYDRDTGDIHVEKVLTTLSDPAVGVFEGTMKLLKSALGREDMEVVGDFVHGTTIIINTLIERKGAKTALITTAGFEDVLEIGRSERYDTYDVLAEYLKPLVPKRYRKGVKERVYSDGEILIPIDKVEIEQILDAFKKEGVESVAVCFLHSYVNPTHEIAVKALAATRVPDIPVSVSIDWPIGTEVERTNTTVANAYVRNKVEKYLERIESELVNKGFHKQPFLITSSGGLSPISTAKQFPIRFVESGPMGGVIASKFFGELAEKRDILHFDMGGTTAKSSLLPAGKIGETSEYEVARLKKFMPGSGILLSIPSVDILEAGAGGGSIAAINVLGLLEVGPESAGSVPGPICYGRGGQDPTVTDADLVIGYLNPDYFLGGEIRLLRTDAAEGIALKLGTQLEMRAEDVAHAIHQITVENMANAISQDAAQKGEDIAQYTMVASGGAGPMYAYDLAKTLGIGQVLIPPYPGVLSAVGFLMAPRSCDVARTLITPLEELEPSLIGEVYEDLRRSALKLLPKGSNHDVALFSLSMDMRYAGQRHEINVPIIANATHENAIRALRQDEVLDAFQDVYSSLYGDILLGYLIEVVNWKMKFVLPPEKVEICAVCRSAGTLGEARKGHRMVYSHKTGSYAEWNVYERRRLPCGCKFAGPALIEERESTTVLGPEGKAEVDRLGILHIQVE